LGEREEKMSTRRILAEAAKAIVAKGEPCGHCNPNHSNRDGTCGCDTCIQGGGVCGECGGRRYFVPLKTTFMNEFLFEKIPEVPVRSARQAAR